MAELKCKTCGTVLDPDPEFCHTEMADGTKYARCSTCSTPYKVPKREPKSEAQPEPKVETPATEPEPEVETPATEPEKPESED